MKFLLSIIVLTTIFLTGCARIDPLSPNLRQDLNNQEGQIEDLRNNQNGLMLELGKIRNQNEMNARDIRDAQQGLLNVKGMQNTGFQFFSGDGGLIAFIGVVIAAFVFIYYYRDRAKRSEKTAEILAQQIALKDDNDLEDNVFMSALNTEVEEDVYHLMVKSQALAGRRQN